MKVALPDPSALACFDTTGLHRCCSTPAPSGRPCLMQTTSLVAQDFPTTQASQGLPIMLCLILACVCIGGIHAISSAVCLCLHQRHTGNMLSCWLVTALEVYRQGIPSCTAPPLIPSTVADAGQHHSLVTAWAQPGHSLVELVPALLTFSLMSAVTGSTNGSLPCTADSPCNPGFGFYTLNFQP